MPTRDTLSGWLEAQLGEADTPASPEGWRVASVLVTAEAAEACELAVADGATVRLAGVGVPLRVLRASGPDVWVELVSLSRVPRESELVHLHLTFRLSVAEAAAYSALRIDGYGPTEARMLAAVIAMPSPARHHEL